MRHQNFTPAQLLPLKVTVVVVFGAEAQLEPLAVLAQLEPSGVEAQEDPFGLEAQLEPDGVTPAQLLPVGLTPAQLEPFGETVVPLVGATWTRSVLLEVTVEVVGADTVAAEAEPTPAKVTTVARPRPAKTGALRIVLPFRGGNLNQRLAEGDAVCVSLERAFLVLYFRKVEWSSFRSHAPII